MNEKLEFKKSSFSSRTGRCVEVAIGTEDVFVRNTKNPKIIVKFTYAEWEAFIDGVKKHEFELKTRE